MLRRNKMLVKVVGIMLMLMLTLVFTVPQGALATDVRSLQAGTTVFVETTEELNADNLNSGDMVSLIVSEDVTVDGKTVIEAGSSVSATVSRAESRGSLGRAGELHLELRDTRAVDGTSVSLTGTRRAVGEDKQTNTLLIGLILCWPVLLRKGGDAIIPANTRIQARVASNYDIAIE